VDVKKILTHAAIILAVVYVAQHIPTLKALIFTS